MEPVRIYAEEDRRVRPRLAAILQGLIEIEVEALVGGVADEAPNDFIRRRGYIAGLKRALHECQAIDKELNG
jgi:hypothetical protein